MKGMDGSKSVKREQRREVKLRTGIYRKRRQQIKQETREGEKRGISAAGRKRMNAKSSKWWFHFHTHTHHHHHQSKKNPKTPRTDQAPPSKNASEEYESAARTGGGRHRQRGAYPEGSRREGGQAGGGGEGFNDESNGRQQERWDAGSRWR